MSTIKIAIHGFGRIGRSVFRRAVIDDRIEVCVINDINPDINNICYLYNYDSIHGVAPDGEKMTVDSSGKLSVGESIAVKYTSNRDVESLDCSGIDVLIDASGISGNGTSLRALLDKNSFLKILVTHIHPDADYVLVLGANEEFLSRSARLISSSICDATALAPVLSCIDSEFSISVGHVSTLHPWLNYQNLLDGPSTSWANPGQIYYHYALGRAAPDSLIPKPTTAISASYKSLPNLSATISSFSYRVPTSIVGSADLVLTLESSPCVNEVIDSLREYNERSPWSLFAFNEEPLISRDFVNWPYSAVVDLRWVEVTEKQLHLVLWYDNENGYAARVLDQALFVSDLGGNK